MTIFWKPSSYGKHREPVVILKRFKNGRAYVQFESGQKKNVAGGELHVVP